MSINMCGENSGCDEPSDPRFLIKSMTELELMLPELTPAQHKWLQGYIATEYRRGYNDNTRDCYCDSPGATEGVMPHHHLMDDGKSHNIRPHIAALTGKAEGK